MWSLRFFGKWTGALAVHDMSNSPFDFIEHLAYPLQSLWANTMGWFYNH